MKDIFTLGLVYMTRTNIAILKKIHVMIKNFYRNTIVFKSITEIYERMTFF